MTTAPVDFLPVIRPMRPADLESVFSVETGAYDYPWTLTIFRDCLRMGYECWVQLATDRVVGHFVLAMGPGEAHVLNLAVDPQWKNRGLGRALLRQSLDRAERLGAESVYLEVRPSNQPAVHLYRSEGFRRVGRRRDYYPTVDGREDALVMRYDLREVASRGG
ncbi:MAG: ribosomal protein S18-alanine N-acetyltransferase [Spiribacter sp.]|jgi:ribosomal-protein-alanine N-acetyltransferase|nr:ribosomal protein S18-alanine N-acetyltransferase [Spiribacter sp.]MDR9489110.1 ribosomal protein S18-alanine N-acetyltransferase [Spiribacter sp.]